MSIKDKMKNAKESHLFDELSEKEKFEAILEGKLKVRLIAELEKIREEIMNKGMIPTHTYITPDGKALQKSVVDVVIDKRIAELKGENK